MSTPLFSRAVPPTSPPRVAIVGGHGAGKKFTALALASAWGGTVLVVDTENGASSAYADLFPHLVMRRSTFSPSDLPWIVAAANEARADTLIVSTLSSYWSGPGGMLETVSTLARRSGSRDKNAAWDEARPVEREGIAALRAFPGRVVVTCRTKVEYVTERDDASGQLVPRPVGTKPDQGGDFMYDWPLVLAMVAGTAIVEKSHYPALTGRIVHHPAAELAADIAAEFGPAPSTTAADIRDLMDLADDMEGLRTLRATVTPDQLEVTLHNQDGKVVSLDALFFERRKALLAAATDTTTSPLGAAVREAAA